VSQLSSFFWGLWGARHFPTLVGQGFVHIFRSVIIRGRWRIDGSLPNT